MSSLTNDLVTVKENIRKKFFALKRGQAQEVEDFGNVFKPIIEPLNDVKSYLSSHQSTNGKSRGKGPKRTKLVKTEDLKKRSKSDSKVENLSDVEYKASSDFSDENLDYNESILRNRGEEEVNASKFEDDGEAASNNTEYTSLASDDDKRSYTSETFRNDYDSVPELELDKKYGVRMNRRKKLGIGNDDVSFDEGGRLTVGKHKYPRTDGLLELITKKNPKSYDEDDLENYRRILTRSGLKNKYWRPQGRFTPKRDRGRDNKYDKIVSKIFEESGKKKKSSPSSSGSGLYKKYRGRSKVQMVYYDDPNELVERIRLLLASRQSGSSAHRNELISLLEELRELRIL